ncbi:MAG: HPr family phosphocarrier protein [Francisellaceae bacterium]
MTAFELLICNQLGLHARAASKLVSIASRFASESKLEVMATGLVANCKSIMGLMMLGASYGTPIKIHVEGDDESDASNAIYELIANRFYEEN